MTWSFHCWNIGNIEVIVYVNYCIMLILTKLLFCLVETYIHRDEAIALNDYEFHDKAVSEWAEQTDKTLPCNIQQEFTCDKCCHQCLVLFCW